MPPASPSPASSPRALRRLARHPLDLAGAVVLVTGGAGGLGRALAREALDRGASVALVDLTAAALDAAAAALVGSAGPEGSPRLSTHVADITDREQVARAVAEVRTRHTGIDVLVNNAGISMAGTFLDSTLEQFDAVVAVNLHGAAAMLYATVPHLRPGGHVVNVSSIAGVVGMPLSSAYSASKFGLRGLSEVLALELPARGVGVSTVVLGGASTGIDANLRFSDGADERTRERLRSAAAGAGRLTTPAKAARVILDGTQRRRATIVVGPDARAITGMRRLAPSALRRLLGLAR